MPQAQFAVKIPANPLKLSVCF